MKFTWSLPNPSKQLFWFSSALIIKLLLFILLSYFYAQNIEKSFISKDGTVSLYLLAADSPTYLVPIDNFREKGIYIENPKDIYSTVIRMPGYGALYYILLLVFSKVMALNVLIIIQWILSALSVYYLALIGYRLSNRFNIFLFTFLLYAFSVYVSMYDMFILTESLSNSLIIISVYLFIRTPSHLQISYKTLLGVGFMMALSVFMRPVNLPILLLLGLYAVLRVILMNTPQVKRGISRAFKSGLIFFLSIIILESAWITRNYLNLSKRVALCYNFWLHPTGEPLRDVTYHAYAWIRAVGEDNVFYRDNSLASWLHQNIFVDKSYQVPDRVFSSKYNLDSLELSRQQFIELEKLRILSPVSKELEAKAQNLNNTFDRYTQSYIQENPWHYQVTNRLRLLKYFLVHSGVQQLPFRAVSELSKTSLEFFLKLAWAGLYWFILIFGLIGLVYLFLDRRIETWLIGLTLVYSLTVFAFLVRIPELRFICLAYPWLTLGTAKVMDVMIIWFGRFFLKSN